MLHVNIYIPAKLRRRMLEADAPRGTWSKLACRAFESWLRTQEYDTPFRTPEELDRVVARLRVSRDKYAPAVLAGEAAGEEWASKLASVADLSALASPLVSISTITERGRLAKQFAAELPSDYAASLGGVADPEIPPVFLTGFTTGALRVWHAVKGEL